MSPRKRLFVHSLTSVGLVADGDDPEARVVLYKSRAEEAPTIETAVGFEKGPTVASLTAAGDRLDHQLGLLREDRRRREDEEKTMIEREIAKSAGEIDRLAAAMMKESPGLSVQAARLRVRREHPGLAVRERAAGGTATGADFVKEERPVTLSDAITRLIHKRADLSAWTEFRRGGPTIGQLRADLWKTPDGVRLRSLQRSEWGDRPLAEALAKVEKSGEHAAALAVLRREL